MNCRMYREMLDNSMAGRGDNFLSDEMEAHSSVCAACTEYRVSIERLTQLIAADEPLPAPADLRANVLSGIEAAASRQRRRRRRILIAIATASFVAAMLVPVGAVVGLGLLITASPAAGAGLVQAMYNLTAFFLNIGGGLWTAAGALLAWLATQPLLPGGLVAGAALGLLWIYLVRHLRVTAHAKVVTS